MRALAAFSAIALGLAMTGNLVAQSSDWPQWGGPNRDHKSAATGLMKEWPRGGPKVVWKFEQAGIGFSSMSVADGKLYTLSGVDGTNSLLCLDMNTGKEQWRKEFAKAPAEQAYLSGWGMGPRSTPTIDGEQVFALDDGGTIACFSKDSGDIIWKRDLVADFGGSIPKWGYSESPLIDGDRVIVCPGGKNFLVALDRNTGKEVLSSSGFDATAHYVSVVIAEVGGVKMYVTASQPGLVGFSAKTGETLWTNNKTGNSVATIPTPIVDGDYIYHTSGYDTGCMLLKLSADGGKVTAQEVYKGNKANKNMQNHHGGVALIDGYLFGFRKKRGTFICQNFETGEISWNERISGDGSAAIAYADGRLYVYGESSGTCYLIEPTPKGWSEKGKVDLPVKTKLDRKRGQIWSHPTIADGKLFLRDLDLIYAFDIKN